MKKVLVMGGCGAMGVYLVPELKSLGYSVTVADRVEFKGDGITTIIGDAMDYTFMNEVLKNGYDAIYDFMIYTDTNDFLKRMDMLLPATQQYFFLSSYRVYADHDEYITENSPRLLDVTTDYEYLKENEYALYKAKEENLLRNSKYNNWTIIRPAITYSKNRFQLVILEQGTVVHRTILGKKVALPKSAMDHYGTMTWAGDVAKMLSRLAFNPDALGQAFTVSTAEHHTWREIADYYKDIIGLDYVVVEDEQFFDCLGCRPFAQLYYDRCYDRKIDNSKILKMTGLKQSDFSTLYDALKRELSAIDRTADWNTHPQFNRLMDKVLSEL